MELLSRIGIQVQVDVAGTDRVVGAVVLVLAVLAVGRHSPGRDRRRCLGDGAPGPGVGSGAGVDCGQALQAQPAMMMERSIDLRAGRRAPDCCRDGRLGDQRIGDRWDHAGGRLGDAGPGDRAGGGEGRAVARQIDVEVGKALHLCRPAAAVEQCGTAVRNDGGELVGDVLLKIRRDVGRDRDVQVLLGVGCAPRTNIATDSAPRFGLKSGE